MILRKCVIVYVFDLANNQNYKKLKTFLLIDVLELIRTQVHPIHIVERTLDLVFLSKKTYSGLLTISRYDFSQNPKCCFRNGLTSLMTIQVNYS